MSVYPHPMSGVLLRGNTDRDTDRRQGKET